jgi:hypothetical protein
MMSQSDTCLSDDAALRLICSRNDPAIPALINLVHSPAICPAFPFLFQWDGLSDSPSAPYFVYVRANSHYLASAPASARLAQGDEEAHKESDRSDAQDAK